MRHGILFSPMLAGLLIAGAPALAGDEPKPEAPQVQIPQPGVPQIMTLEGKFIRVAYNNEGYVILGYQAANRSVGEEWVLLEVGITVRDGVPDTKMTREALSLDTPDGKTVPLATVAEFRAASTQALQNRAKVQHDNINYFPPGATTGCRLGFFSDLDSPGAAWDVVELNSSRGCLGRLYFHVPGGIQYGQHWLNVKFEQTLVRVPFRVLTKEEEKTFSKHYKAISKQVDAAFKPKKK